MTTRSRKDELEQPAGPLIGVVGPCGAGKSTLIAGLNRMGYRTRHIAQEHSYVKDMWKRLTNPDILIFLDASWSVTCERRKLNWTQSEWKEQEDRLIHARIHASLYLDTDTLSADTVLEKVVKFIKRED